MNDSNNWNTLSMKDRLELMKVYTKNSITDLDQIKEHYNSYSSGGPISSNNSNSYDEWKEKLPDNLKNTNPQLYNLKGAYDAGLQPSLGDDEYYHLGSRNPSTGEILKYPMHPTFGMALQEDPKLGYLPIEKNGKTYTKHYNEAHTFNNNFSTGGALDGNQTSTPKDSTKETTDFIKNWYNNRRPQIIDNYDSVKGIGDNINNLFKSRDEITQDLIDNTVNKLDTVKEVTTNKNNKSYLYDPTAKTTSSFAYYDKGKHLIAYNTRFKDKDIEVHEKTHATTGLYNDYRLLNISKLVHNKYKKDIYKKNTDSTSNIEPSHYWDSPDEINARLMEFRFNNKLDPKKVIKKEDFVKYRDSELLNRYNDSFLLDLLNKIASKDTKNNKLVASNSSNRFDNGGYLNSEQIVTPKSVLYSDPQLSFNSINTTQDPYKNSDYLQRPESFPIIPQENNTSVINNQTANKGLKRSIDYSLLPEDVPFEINKHYKDIENRERVQNKKVDNTSINDNFNEPIKPFIGANCDKSDISECTKFNRMHLQNIGNNPEAVGFKGDAWTVGNNIIDSGGEVVYDSGYTLNRNMNPNEINNKISSSINMNKLNTSTLKEGDVLDLQYTNSGYISRATEDSDYRTGTTHNGIIVNKDNKLAIQHNIGGKVYYDDINEYSPHIARVYRPNYGRPDFNSTLRGREGVKKHSGVSTIKSVFGIGSYDNRTKEDAVYDLTGNEVDFVRVGEYNPNIKTDAILFNQFIESKDIPRNVLTAKDFKNLKNTSPNRIVTNASGEATKRTIKEVKNFYGIENGKLKINSLDNFKPTTIVTPITLEGNVKTASIKDNALRLTDKDNQIIYNNVKSSKGKLLVNAKFNYKNEPTDSTKLLTGTPEFIKNQINQFATYNKDVKAVMVDNGRNSFVTKYKDNRPLTKEDYSSHYSADWSRDYYPGYFVVKKKK